MRTPGFVPLTGMRTPTAAPLQACSHMVKAYIPHSTQRHRHLSPPSSASLLALPRVCNGLCVCRSYVLLRSSPRGSPRVLSVLSFSRVPLSFVFAISLQKLLQGQLSKCSPCLVTVCSGFPSPLCVFWQSDQPFISHWMEPATNLMGLKGPGAFFWGLTQ